MEDQELELYIAELQEQGYSEDEIFETLELIQGEEEGKPTELETEDAAVTPVESTASELEDTSSEYQPTQEEHNAQAESLRTGLKTTLNSFGLATPPDFLMEPLLGFQAGLVGIAGDATKFVEQQVALFDKDFQRELRQMTAQERVAAFEDYYTASDFLSESADALQSTQGQYGTGSISTEFAEGNLANAAKLTANQTAQGLASLVPFMVPGGTIIGPAVLGASAAGSAFGEDLHREGASMEEIYAASYAKGGVEFATELVTAGIAGRAKKLLGGGAAAQAVKEYQKSSFRAIAGDTFSEGVSEGLADTGSRLVDKIIFDDEFDGKEAVIGFIDSAIVGAIVGGKVSSFGQIGANNVGKEYAAHALKDQDQKKRDQDRVNKISENQKIIQEADTEGSIVEKALADAAQAENDKLVSEIQEDNKKHKEALDEMTSEELKEYAENKDEADKLETALADPKVAEEAKEPLQKRVEEKREAQSKVYQRVRNDKEVTKKKKEVEKKLDDAIKKDEATLKDSAKPQTSADGKAVAKTEKQKIAEKEARERVKENKKKKEDLNKAVERKGVKPEVKVSPKDNTQKRKDNNVSLTETIQNPRNENDKRRAQKKFLDNNAGIIRNAVNSILKNGDKLRGDDLKIAESIAQQELLRRAETFDPKKGIDLQQRLQYEFKRKVNSAFKQQDLRGKINKKRVKELTEQQQEELDYYKQLRDDQVISLAEFQEFEDSLTQDYAKLEEIDSAVDETAQTKIEEEIATAAPEIEQADADGLEKLHGLTRADGAKVEAAVVEAVQEGLPEPKVQKDRVNEDSRYQALGKKVAKVLDINVDEFLSNPTDAVYAALPNYVKLNKKFFDGLFTDGNPDPLIWDSYFNAEGRQGKDRKRALKEAFAAEIADQYLDRALSAQEYLDSDQIDNLDSTSGSIEFLEGDKTSVKAFLPLLAKLKKNFPGTRIIISKSKMVEDFIAAGIDPAKADNVKGYTDGSVVVLNPDKLDAETPIHEYGHIWAQATRSLRPDLYAKGAKLVRQSSEWLELTEKRKDPNSVYYEYSDARLEEEAMATVIGKHGEQIFESKEDQTQWNKLRKQIWDWIGSKIGIQKVEDLTLDQFVKLAATEIITGEQFIGDGEILEAQDSLGTQFREVPVGSTKNYSGSKAPVAEFDTHGQWKTGPMTSEVLTAVNKYYNELDAGGFIGWVTGTYGKAAKDAGKYDPKLSARIEAKVEGMRKQVAKEGLELVQDPVNPGFHKIRKPIEFLEETNTEENKKDLNKIIQRKIKRALKPYKTESAYKKARVSKAHSDVLKATLADLQKRGESFTEVQLSYIEAAVADVINNGKEAKKAQRKEEADRKEQIQEVVSDAVQNTSGYTVGDVKAAKEKAKEKDSWTTRKGMKRAFSIANILSPSTNNDFFGLLYDLLPKGAKRLDVQDSIDNILINPLKDANLKYLAAKKELRDKFVGLKENVFGDANAAKEALNGDSTVIYEGQPLRNDDVVKVYNYLKDPSTYRQVDNTLSKEQLTEIVEYINANPQLKQFADRLPDVYAGIASRINTKLDEHGRETFDKVEIDQSKLSPEKLELLNAIYDGAIPKFAVYTPLTAEGSDTDLDTDALIAGDKYANYTVMDGRLKQRTGGGELTLRSNNLDADFDTYLSGPVRTYAFLDFARNAGQFFGPEQIKAMRAAYGDKWAGAMKDSLRRIVSGKNERSKQNAVTRSFDRWINQTVGTVMTLNVRSAVLQLISTSNFAVNDADAFMAGIRATRADKRKVKAFLKGSAWVEERGAGKTDLAIDAIFDGNKSTFVDTVLQKGYVLTKAGDKFAITVGGAPYMTGKYIKYKKEGLSDEQAMEKAYGDFIEQAEETQQSTRPERLGQSQTTSMGKLILAFANTPMQYNRKIAKSIKDLSGLRGVKGERAQKIRRQAYKNIAYYGALQNMVFTSLQRLVLPGVSADIEDEGLGWANALLDTVLRGIGIWGAVVAAFKNAAVNALTGEEDRVVSSLISVSPAIGTKIRHIETALGAKKIYQRSELVEDAEIYQVAAALNAATNIPADRVLKLAEQAHDVILSDLNAVDKIARAGGWSRYDIDEPAGNKPLN